ncbi:MAG: 23S rRNA (guanosine(2251)-2'-O)-methyltransferase RlmB [Firmicutes bacterium]|nr:23S rRNA (guanosine(2251)-2'-O)-methyltransferase RlmB [Bacillota bacterium]
MAKVKNRRDNHETKRGRYYAERGREVPGREGSGTGRRDGRGQSAGHSTAKSAGRSAARPERAQRAERPAHRDDRRESFDPFGRSDRYDRENGFGEPDPNVIIGRNPVTEILKNDRPVDKLMVSSREGSMIKILALAKEKSVPVIMVEKVALDRIAGGRPHQGVIAYVSPYEYAEMEDIFALAEERGEDPFIIILDNLEDPHNLGAIMRTAECAGAHGIIIPRRHACGLTEVVAKSSAGAIEYMPVVKVTNIAQTIEELKEMGIWVAACDMGGQNYYDVDLCGKIAVVIGSEGAGISKLVRDKCDYVVSMPMVGRITSLNASNAAAIIIYEIRKQRDTGLAE